jgi:hypothetical protein
VRSSLLFAVLLACRHGVAPPVDTDGDTDTDTDRPLPGCVPACDRLCVPERAQDSAQCLDTYGERTVCYDLGFQRCERQPDGACGWTMLDQRGWDACWANPP